MFWKENRNHRIPYMMMTLKGGFKGENKPQWYCVPLADQKKVVYLKEGGSVGYYTVDVIWRIRNGVSCSIGKTGGRQSLETRIPCSEIYWS